LRLLKGNGKHFSKVTIEVNSDGYIVQAKGPFNQQPSEAYLDTIQMWARANDIEGY